MRSYLHQKIQDFNDNQLTLSKNRIKIVRSMEMEEYESETEMLKDIVKDLNEMISESRKDRQELVALEAELKKKLKQNVANRLTFDIEIEQLRRTKQDVDYTLRNLAHQKKLTIRMIDDVRRLEE